MFLLLFFLIFVSIFVFLFLIFDFVFVFVFSILVFVFVFVLFSFLPFVFLIVVFVFYFWFVLVFVFFVLIFLFSVPFIFCFGLIFNIVWTVLKITFKKRLKGRINKSISFLSSEASRKLVWSTPKTRPRLASFVVNNFESYVVIEIRFNSFCAYLQQPNLKLDVDVYECSSNVPSLSKSVYRLSIYTLQRSTVQTNMVT